MIVACALVAIRASAPPEPLGADAPEDQFSAERALRDVRVIAQRPHPVGTGDHARVRYYLLARLRELGLTPVVKAATVAQRNRAGADVFARVGNVVAEMKGSDATGAVMLVAHYDSVPASPGAGDDASGVATILETVRALRAGPPLRNDLVVLLSDAEELGLLGAKAFVENRAPLGSIKAVLNFDMRGNAGPVWMFETSRDNAWLVEQLARVAPYPHAASLTPEIYRRMPNDTDFTIFARAGLAGMNFAAARGLASYHTRLDTAARLDLRTLQHHGSYALSLARHLGSVALNDPGDGDDLYFTVGSHLFHYRMRLALPIAIGVALVVIATLVIVARSARFAASAVAVGFAAFIAGAIIAVLEAWLGWQLMAWVAADRMLEAGTTYGGPYFTASIIVLIGASLWRLYALLARRFDAQSLGAGVLLAWAAVMLLATVRLPGASYLLTWPLIFAALALAWDAHRGDERRTAISRTIAALVAIAPGVAMLAPLLTDAADGTMLFMLLSAMLAALMLVLTVPYMDFLSGGRPGIVGAVLAICGALLFGSGYIASAFGPSQPRPDSIFYNLNTDTGTALFASLDNRPDHWTAQFLKRNPRMSSLAMLAGADVDGAIAVTRGTSGSPASALRALGGNRLIVGQAPRLDLAPPEITEIGDVQDGDQRIVNLGIKSARGAPLVMMVVQPGVQVRTAAVDGTAVSGGASDGWAGWFWGVPKGGFVLTLAVGTQGTFKVTVTDISWGLPTFGEHRFAPRPPDVMPRASARIDSTTQVSKSLVVGSSAAIR
jgi:hypothetical protein